MRPIPVAIVLRTFDPGGTERQMIELIRRLDPARWRVHVACFQARGAWFDRAEEAAASVAEFPVCSFRRAATIHQARAFSAWCQREAIAIVHASDISSNVFAMPAAAFAGVPARIASRREINAGKTVFELALQRGAYAFAHTMIANSHAVARRLRLELVPERRIAIIPNGLDTTRIEVRAPRAALRRVVVVANLRPEKRHDVLMRAAPFVLSQFPDASFHFVGDGPERGRLGELAVQLGVSGAFEFCGHCEDVPRCLGEADIFVLPSESEGFPNAVLEAMAAGLPIVASATGGILELIDDGRTGLLAPAGDTPRLADAICRLMRDPQQAGVLGDRASREARSRYSFDRMVNACEELYLELLSRRAATPGWLRRAAGQAP